MPDATLLTTRLHPIPIVMWLEGLLNRYRMACLVGRTVRVSPGAARRAPTVLRPTALCLRVRLPAPPQRRGLRWDLSRQAALDYHGLTFEEWKNADLGRKRGYCREKSEIPLSGLSRQSINCLEAESEGRRLPRFWNRSAQPNFAT